jgi:hypothetical protein
MLMVPPFACDCPMHVLGAPGSYAVPEVSSYSPREASLASWQQVAGRLGIKRRLENGLAEHRRACGGAAAGSASD